jgi:hypothetical protein
MNKLTLAVIGLLSLSGCAHSNENPYITDCTVPACEAVAKETNSDYSDGKGVEIVAGLYLALALDSSIKKVVQQNDMLAVVSGDGRKLVASPLRLSDLELTGNGMPDMPEFVSSVFLRSFRSLEAEKPAPKVLHAVRSLKLLYAGQGPPEYFERGELTAFYSFDKRRNQHSVLAVDTNNKNTAMTLDLYDFSARQFEHFKSTLRIYTP